MSKEIELHMAVFLQGTSEILFIKKSLLTLFTRYKIAILCLADIAGVRAEVENTTDDTVEATPDHRLLVVNPAALQSGDVVDHQVT